MTKRERLVALLRVYRDAVGKKVVTPTEVIIWATAANLWPCPGKFDPLSQCLAWEARLREVRLQAQMPPKPVREELLRRLRAAMRRIEQGKPAKPKRRRRKP